MNRTESEILRSLSLFRDAADNSVAVFYGSQFIDGERVLGALIRDRRSLCYRAACVSDREQRRRMASMSALKASALSDAPSYKEIFSALLSRVPSGERLILLFKDFERFFYEDGLFLRELAEAIKAPENAGRLSVFLISDDEVWVENSFVERAGDCAAAVSGFVKKRESGFRELRESFQGLALKDAVSVYSLFGGETALWRFYDSALSFKENIIALFLESGGALKELATDRLKRLVREPAVYMTILANLAAGNEKLNDLYHATLFPRAKLSVYLRTLMEPLFVEKVFSYGSVGTTHTKKGVYRISNAFLGFYFKVIYPHEHEFFGGDNDKLYDMYIAQALGEAAESAFRRICLEYMESLDGEGRLPFNIADEGEWNGKAGSIDIVAQGENGETLIGTCSYRNVLTEEDYHFILKYARQAGLEPDHIYMFSGQGFDEGLLAAARVMGSLHLIGSQEIENG